jgi:hypothetical protein
MECGVPQIHAAKYLEVLQKARDGTNGAKQPREASMARADGRAIFLQRLVATP